MKISQLSKIPTKMERNIHCRADERIKILTLRNKGKSQREKKISKIIGRSRKMVENALRRKNNEEIRSPK